MFVGTETTARRICACSPKLSSDGKRTVSTVALSLKPHDAAAEIIVAPREGSRRRQISTQGVRTPARYVGRTAIRRAPSNRTLSSGHWRPIDQLESWLGKRQYIDWYDRLPLAARWIVELLHSRGCLSRGDEFPNTAGLGIDAGLRANTSCSACPRKGTQPKPREAPTAAVSSRPLPSTSSTFPGWSPIPPRSFSEQIDSSGTTHATWITLPVHLAPHYRLNVRKNGEKG
jgi:hypothetical protein